MYDTQLIEDQLNQLRERLREIRTARKWLQEYRVNAPVTLSKPLAQYHNWLCDQEKNTIQMGIRLKNGN